MKRFASTLIAGVILLILGSCSMLIGTNGKDGSPGPAYIKYSWVTGPISFTTNDPSFGTTIYNDVYETAHVGSWNFSYVAWDNSRWSGKYTVYKNPGTAGEPGTFLKDGKDGVDGAGVWFELSCLSLGPSFYAWSYEFRSLANSDSRIQLERNRSTEAFADLKSTENTGGEQSLVEQSFTSHQVLTAGGYTVVLDYGRTK